MAGEEILPQNVEAAAQRIRDVLATLKPGKDYGEGTVLGDQVVDAYAVVDALIRDRTDELKNLLSLRYLKDRPDDEETRDFADAILANFLCSRAQGTFSRGTVFLHFSQRVDVRIPRNARFFKTPSNVFYPDAPTDVFLRADQMRANVNDTGVVTDWVVPMYAVAARAGVEYDLDPGEFSSFDPVSPFLLKVENLAKFAGGANLQSTSDFISASENALSARVLVNARSNDITLRGQLFRQIQSLLTVGRGDPEMQRDLASDPATGVEMHVGGHSDIYVRLQVQEVVERLQIGQLTARADGLVNILRDPSPPSGSFIAAGFMPGDILRIADGLPEAPFEYVVKAVRATELEVRPRVPFSVATDEETVIPAISYTGGDNYPLFDNKASVSATATVTTSRKFALFNRVILPGRPTYRIKKVELLDPPPILAAFADPTTDTVVFHRRDDGPTLLAPTPGDTLGFFVEGHNPLEGQSDRAVISLGVGWPGVDLTGYELEVTYDTLLSFDPISDYVRDEFNRNVDSNSLVRAFHPAYVTCSVPYLARSTGAVDEVSVEADVVTFIDNTPQGGTLDTGAIGSAAKDASPSIAAVYPFTAYYELPAPTGVVYRFATEDVVTVFPDGSNTARLLDPTEFGLPPTNYYAKLKRQLLLLGVSGRTVRYLANDEGVGVEKRS